MSLFSTAPNGPPLSPAKAWSLAAANQLLWPGMGTAMAKRRGGLLQMGISGAGLVMVMVGFFGLLARCFNANGELPGWRDPFVLTALLGLALFLLAWFWALFSSAGMIRSARANRLPPQF
jgi:hypothetical protein